MSSAYDVVRQFETRVAEYTGSPFAVSVDSCSAALFLCCKYLAVGEVTIPSKTYVSVPCSIIHAGGRVKFEDKHWRGCYQLKPYKIYDAALRFTKGMYQPGTFTCLSFHYKKILPIGRGGMILLDDEAAVAWFKKARFNGREEVPLEDQENFDVVGWNYYMDPERAARGMALMDMLPEHNGDRTDTYPDLSRFSCFLKRGS